MTKRIIARKRAPAQRKRRSQGSSRAAAPRRRRVQPKPRQKKSLSQERLRAALRAGRVYMFDWDLRTDRVLRSESAVQILGSRTAFRGTARHYFEAVHPKDRDLLKQKLFELGPRRKSFSLEYRIIRPDGSILWVLDSGEGEFNTEGNLIRLHGVTSDITWRKRVEEVSHEHERQARVLLDAVPMSALLVEPTGKIVVINRIAAAALGQNADDMIGRNAYAYLESEVAVACRARIDEVCRTGEPVRFQDKRFGRVIDNFVHPVKAADGAVRLLAVFGADITERQRAEESLRINEERLRQAVHVAGLGIFDHDHRADTIEWSPELRQMCGISLDERVSLTSFLELVHPEDRQAVAEAIQRAHSPAGTGAYAVELRVVWPEGTVRWLSQRSRTFFEGEGSAREPVRTVGAVADITEQKQAAEQMRLAKEELAAINSALERRVQERTRSLQQTTDQLNAFVYTIAHDLRAPLRAQIAYSALLLKEHGAALGATGRDFATKVLQAAERQGNLLTDLLGHISLERSELPLTRVDLRSALDQVLADLRPEIQKSGATVDCQNVSGAVWANEASLQLVLSNLLGNALKFVPPDRTPCVRVRSEIRPQELPVPVEPGRARPGVARVWVEDNGIGIEPRYFEKLFEVFQRLHPAGKYPGTGIGLALVKKAVERMGGAVGIESQPGQGSRFWIEFALAHGRVPGELQLGLEL